MKMHSLLMFLVLLMTAFACTELPQGEIIDQAEEVANPIVDPDTTVTRPSDQIFIESNFCACKKGKPVNVSANCENQCATQATTDARVLLYLTVTTGATLQSSQFQNLQGWCSQNLIDPDTGDNLESGTNPGCQIVFSDKEVQNSSLPIAIPPANINGNSINAFDISTLPLNKRYGFTINEFASNLNSSSKDIRVYTELVDTLLDVPLWIENIYQYACISSTVTTDPNNGGTVYYDNAEKIHFYYSSDNRPDPIISTTNVNINCHTQAFPNNQTPLIDQTPGQIKTWSKNDVRFADYVDPDTGSTAAGDLYIDRIITQLVSEYSNSTIQTLKLFKEFRYFTDPLAASATNTQQALLGYIMIPLKDTATQEWYCPQQSHYYSADPVMKSLREIVREDTQALYLAKQQNKDDDHIFILEEDVKPAWFYLNENNVEVEPTDATIRGKKIQFYWPISTDTPRQKKPHQVVYTIQPGSTTINPANLPPDNRIGCAPKI